MLTESRSKCHHHLQHCTSVLATSTACLTFPEVVKYKFVGASEQDSSGFVGAIFNNQKPFLALGPIYRFLLTTSSGVAIWVNSHMFQKRGERKNKKTTMTKINKSESFDSRNVN
jgi:hypothetical protein